MLAFIEQRGGRTTLVLSDVSLRSFARIDLPPEAIFASPIISGLSPDGEYFAFFEGGVVDPEWDHLESVSPDFHIRVVSLKDGETVLSQALVSTSYPDDLAEVASTILQYEMLCDPASLEEAMAEAQYVLLGGFRCLAWSPDGSLLAFASQRAGASSDMHLFNSSTKATWRASSEPGHIQRLDWSPSGEFIAVGSGYVYCPSVEDVTDVYSRRGDKAVSAIGGYFLGWLDPAWVLTANIDDMGDMFSQLSAISVPSGIRTWLWGGSLSEYALAPKLSRLLVSSEEPQPYGSEEDLGLFLTIPGTSPLQRLSHAAFPEVAYLGSPQFAFAASSTEEGTFGITRDNRMVPIDHLAWGLSASPNGKYLAAFGPAWHVARNRYLEGVFSQHPLGAGLRIFSGAGELLATLTEDRVNCVQWSADSARLAYQVPGSLFYWEPTLSTAQHVQSDFTTDCQFEWVNQGP